MIELLKTQIRPDSGFQEEHEFIPYRQEVEPGHTFYYGDRVWEVTWCSKAKVGWLLDDCA